MKSLIDTSENMTTKYYTIDIKIYNDFGELAEKKLTFPTLEDMSICFWENGVIENMVNDSIVFAKENNMVLEELYESKEDAMADATYLEDISPTSDLNNPANFAN
jgi:hypothetical protein